MKLFKSSKLAVTLTLAMLTGFGLTVSFAQSDAMKKQMAMMQDMMKNRPKDMAKADQSIQKQKQTATKDGKYGCCLKHACDYCALKMGQCPCGMNAAKDMAVCNECKGGWHAGDGAIPGKKAEDIKTMPRMDMGM